MRRIPTLRSVLRATIAAVCLGTIGSAMAQQEPKVLNIYNWSDYIGDDTISKFEKETGIKVNYANFDSSESLHAKLTAGKTGYDIVVTSTEWAALQIPAKMFRPLDRTKLSNFGNLDPVMLEKVAAVDPGNQYLVSWLWGYETVGINTKKVKDALGSLPMPENAWDLVFDPKYASKLKACGISFLDAASTVVPPALQYLGKDPYSRDKKDYKQAQELLAKVRPNIRLFSSSTYINDLSSGALCAVLGYSGDINIARQRALELKNGHDIVALMPPKGVSFMDNMAIPADAAHPNNAHLFMNYILRPEVHAGLSNKVFYGNINLASIPFVDKELAQNKSVFLNEADKKKMQLSTAVDAETRRVRTRVYTAFKTGVGL